jgi:hypothetical protein
MILKTICYINYKLLIMKKYLLLVNVLFCFQVIYCQNVGINTPTPEAALDVNGDVIYRTSELTVADGINIALDVNTARFSYYRLTGPVADFTVAGITAGNDGRLLTLFNRTGFTMQINNEDAGAAATDMIVTGTAANITLPNKGIINMQYDATEQKWIVKSSSKGSVAGGGSFWDASGSNIVNNNAGNVGIGTSNPASKLTIQTPINTGGWRHVGGSDSIIVSEGIGGVSASLGTATNHIMRFNSNGLGRMHIYPNGNVTVGDNNAPATDKFTVQSEAYGLTHTNSTGTITVGTYIGSFQGATGGWIGTKSNNPFNFFANNGGALMTILPNGNIGIGTVNPTYKLSVLGKIRSTEVVVEIGWADYVFDKKYKLTPLNEVEKYIEEHKHLSGIPSAAEIEKNGLQLGDTQKKMMEKIEELTLYMIEANKKIERLELLIKQQY